MKTFLVWYFQRVQVCSQSGEVFFLAWCLLLCACCLLHPMCSSEIQPHLHHKLGYMGSDIVKLWICLWNVAHQVVIWSFNNNCASLYNFCQPVKTLLFYYFIFCKYHIKCSMFFMTGIAHVFFFIWIVKWCQINAVHFKISGCLHLCMQIKFCVKICE